MAIKAKREQKEIREEQEEIHEVEEKEPEDRRISQLERLLNNFERMELEEYLLYVNDRRRLFLNNLLIGMGRGLGSAIGFTVLSAIVIVLLQHVVVENIPVIGDFLAEVVRIVQARLDAH